MTIASTHHGGSARRTPITYRSLPSDAVIRRICFRGDRTALNEFHNNRRLFRLKHGQPLLLGEYVESVLLEERRGRLLGFPSSVLERAYDLTIDKFSVLPACTHSGSGPKTRGSASQVKRRGPDCRLYFRMIAKQIHAWRSHQGSIDPLALEAATARITQRRVACHCWWSCLEACRGTRQAWSRYTWELPDGAITLWLPRWLPGSERRPWLECHVSCPDPTRSGEKGRIQRIIDDYFGTPEPVAFDEVIHATTDSNSGSVLDMLVAAEIAEQGLETFVAREKSMRIDEQRRAIRRLGKCGLHALIHRVFDDLAADAMQDHVIAHDFGLSKATFSRFAGSHWAGDQGKSIPDLWKNVAQIVAHVPAFREAAILSGLWDKIETVNHQSDC